MSSHFAIAITSKGNLEEVQVSTPTPGPGEVLIRVHYAALIPFDTYQLDRGYLLTEKSYPHVIGFSASGLVKAVGEGVTDLKVGDRVASFNYPAAKNKALQEYTLVLRNLVAKVPDSFPLDKAASMPDNFTTSLCTIFGLSSFALPLPSSFPAQQPPATADAPVLVYGAGSSSGQYMIQIFKLSGFTNIIGIASPRNHEYLKELGAKHCFDYRSPTLAQDVLSATEGVKVALAVDNIATKTTLTAISQVVGKGSKLAILMPVKDGETVTNPIDKEMYIGLPPFVNSLFEETDVYTVYTFKNQEDPVARETFMPKVLPQLLENNLIRPNPIRLLNRNTLLERALEGLDLLRNNKISGEKVIIELPH